LILQENNFLRKNKLGVQRIGFNSFFERKIIYK
jgi:hypothetical protein